MGRGIERRKHQRYAVLGGNFPGYFEDQYGNKLTSRVVDISSSGLGMIFTETYSTGSIIKLCLDDSSQRIELRLRWIMPVEPHDVHASVYRAGLEAVDTHVHLERVLRRFETLLLEDLS